MDPAALDDVGRVLIAVPCEYEERAIVIEASPLFDLARLDFVIDARHQCVIPTPGRARPFCVHLNSIAWRPVDHLIRNAVNVSVAKFNAVVER
jgi:hypothetical protein